MERTQSWEDVDGSFYRDELLSMPSSSSSFSGISSSKRAVSEKMTQKSALADASNIPKKGNVYISLVPINTGLMY